MYSSKFPRLHKNDTCGIGIGHNEEQFTWQKKDLFDQLYLHAENDGKFREQILGYFPYIDRNLPTNYVSPFKPHGTM
jgi:hypothetical protein